MIPRCKHGIERGDVCLDCYRYPDTFALAMEAAKPTRREAGSARKGDSAGPKDNAQ